MSTRQICLSAALVAALLVPPASAAVHAVLPNCCVPTLGVIYAMNPATGAIERMLSTGKGSGGSGPLAITKDGKSAAFMSGLYPNFSPQAPQFNLINLSTGKISGPLILPGVSWGGSVVVNPNSGVVYAEYLDQSVTPPVGRLYEIEPATLTVLRNVENVEFTNITVSPDGKTIYWASSNSVTAADAGSLAVIGTITLPSLPTVAVSPDSSTLYVTYLAPFATASTLDIVDAATLQVTQSISLGIVVGEPAVSPDGSEVYFPSPAGLAGMLLLLNSTTLELSSIPVAPGDYIAVSPTGSLYWVSGQDVVLFDPVSQTITTTFPAPANVFSVVLDPLENVLFVLASPVSTLALTAAPPSQTILGSGASGYTPYSGGYDSVNKLVLLPDSRNNVNVLDATTLEPKGYVPLPYTAFWVAAGGGSGYAVVGLQPIQVVQFDPVSLTITGSTSIPIPIADDESSSTQPVVEGSHLYVPFNYWAAFNFDCGNARGCRSKAPVGAPTITAVNNGIAVIDTDTMTLASILPLSNITGVYGFAIVPGKGKAYVTVGVNAKTSALVEINISTGAILRSAAISGSYLAAAPDGATIYVLSNGGLEAVSTKTLSVTNSLPNAGLLSLSITPDGAYIYGVTATGYDIISTSALTVVGSIASTTLAGPPSTAIFVN